MTTHLKYGPQQTFAKYNQTGQSNQITSIDLQGHLSVEQAAVQSGSIVTVRSSEQNMAQVNDLRLTGVLTCCTP